MPGCCLDRGHALDQGRVLRIFSEQRRDGLPRARRIAGPERDLGLGQRKAPLRPVAAAPPRRLENEQGAASLRFQPGLGRA